MAKLAILTVVKNAEHTVRQTVESVLAQTFADFDYYLADGGSDDATPDILRAFAAQDARVKLLPPETGGHTAVFNAALAAIYQTDAEYLTFLYADDWMEPDGAEAMIVLAEAANADVVAARFLPHGEDGAQCAEPLLGFGDNVVVTAEEFCDNFAVCAMFPTAYKIWGKLFRVPLLRAAALEAGPARDAGFAADYYPLCKTIAFCDEIAVHYRVRGDSLSHRRLTHYHAAAEARGQALLRAARFGLLDKTGCNNEESRMMASYLTVREAFEQLERLLDADMPAADIAAGLENVLALPLLPDDWAALTAALENSNTLFGMAPEAAWNVMNETDCTLREAVAFVCGHSKNPLEKLLKKWMPRLCPALMQYFSAQELPALAQNTQLFQNLLVGEYRAALLSLNNVPAADYKHGVPKAFLCRLLHVGDEFVAQFLKTHGAKLDAQKRAFLAGGTGR